MKSFIFRLRSLHANRAVVFYASLWMSLNVVVTLYNKHVLTTFNFPIILTTWHLVVTTLGVKALAMTTPLGDDLAGCTSMHDHIPSILLVGLAFSLNLILNNAAFAYLSVAFIQMFKTISPVVVFLAGYLTGLYYIHARGLLVVYTICIGVTLSSYTESNPNLIGIIMLCGAMAFEAVRLLLVEILLSSRKQSLNPFLSLYYFSPVCAAFCCIFAVLFEAHRFSLAAVTATGFWTLFGSALSGFMLNVSAVLLISRSSALTLSICGVPKAMVTVFASTALLHEVVTPLQVGGFGIASLGLLGYGFCDVKRRRGDVDGYTELVSEKNIEDSRTESST
ncbi:uncharacterized protein KD926_002935 [Aspergillus affinis]|uniref:uncharacterized protein n=1 Tax=Aspergillus affinis TaxID=1070780 RepID=UPI0022FF279E|nr:uncharacterized protein KD926_002935 [Aspergillus affinis]KAI9035746.1 hypothetical protein KD926_002935 [Aspergillus affinis]